MNNKFEKLVDSILELVTLLRSHGVDYWADWLRDDADLIQSDDYEGISHLLSAFGGMGSITDLFISPIAGHKIEKADVEFVNQRVSLLLTKIYAFAKELH